MYICDDPICDSCCDFCWYCTHDEYGTPVYCLNNKKDEFSDGVGYCECFKCSLHESKPDDFDALSKKKYEEQLARVIHMEVIADSILNALASEHDAFRSLGMLESEIRELTVYYESPAWQEDYDAERKGVFPQNIKRGILTEDMLYDLLSDVERLMCEKH